MKKVLLSLVLLVFMSFDGFGQCNEVNIENILCYPSNGYDNRMYDDDLSTGRNFNVLDKDKAPYLLFDFGEGAKYDSLYLSINSILTLTKAKYDFRGEGIITIIETFDEYMVEGSENE